MHRNFGAPNLHSRRPQAGNASVLSLIVLTASGVAGCQSSPEEPPSCSDVADHVFELFGGTTGGENAREVRGVFATRCSQDGWSEAARSCIGATVALSEPRGCKAHLSASQTAALDRELAQAEERALAETIPATCKRYQAVVTVLQRCESFPAAARHDLAQKLEAFEATWASTPDKRALEPTCSSAIAAVRLAAAGCPGASKW